MEFILCVWEMWGCRGIATSSTPSSLSRLCVYRLLKALFLFGTKHPLPLWSGSFLQAIISFFVREKLGKKIDSKN